MNLEILPSAIRDISFGRDFYEEQEEGVGTYFLDSVFSRIESLRLFAGVHRKIGVYHRVLMRNFPYAIYYKLEGETIMIYRVLDCRRKPSKIKRDLGLDP